MSEVMTKETENEKLKEEIDKLNQDLRNLRDENGALREIIVRMSAEKYLQH